MKRTLASAAAVIAVTLGVTTPAHADTPTAAASPAKDAPSAPAIVAIPVPTVATPTVAAPTAAVAPAVGPPQAPKAAVVAAASTPAVPAVTLARPSAPTPAPALAAAAAVVAASPPVAAAAPPVAAPAVAAAKEPEAPLALRPPAPLTLAAEPPATPWGYKALFGAAILAAGVLVWKKRRALAANPKAATPVRVLGKTTMGLRGELALVEVGGMRLLVGITPSSMQTLAVLPDDFTEAALAAEEAAEARVADAAPRAAEASRASSNKSDLASRARALFTTLDAGPPIPARVAATSFAASRYADERDSDSAPDSAPAPNRARTRESEAPAREADRRRRTPRDLPLEGQARGIALALGNRR
jgi:flagellar biogenesis protein FliO